MNVAINDTEYVLTLDQSEQLQEWADSVRQPKYDRKKIQVVFADSLNKVNVPIKFGRHFHNIQSNEIYADPNRAYYKDENGDWYIVTFKSNPPEHDCRYEDCTHHE